MGWVYWGFVGKCEAHVEKLIDNSVDNWWTVQYDNFQKMTNGISP